MRMYVFGKLGTFSSEQFAGSIVKAIARRTGDA